jgi:hypothetical protein
MAPNRSPMRQRHAPTDPRDDTWVDRVADEVSAVLREHRLDMEMVVFYDPVGEQLHAVGFDGNPARFFASLGSGQGSAAQCVGDPAAPRTSEGPRSSQVLTSAP